MSRTDVLIIGAGLSGAMTATALAGHGFDVHCLEQGSWPDYGKPVHPLEFDPETHRRWTRVPGERGSAGDYPIDASASPVEPLMWNGVGGSTVLYLAKWHRMLPSDFRVRSLDGVGEDWPFGYEELAPHYAEAERQLGVSGLAGDPAYPPADPPPHPPLPLRDFGRRVAHGLDSLGWDWWPGASAVFPRENAARLPHSAPAAGEALGATNTGLRRTVKASTDVTHWPGALRAGVGLTTGAQVRRLLFEGGRVAGVEYCAADGRLRTMRAEHVILCANGIGTSRLLLASDAGAGRDAGAANSSGLVGRNLMLHPLAAVAGVFDEEVDGAVSPLGTQLQSTHFYETDRRRGFVRGAKWGLQPAGGPESHLFSYPWTADPRRWGRDFSTTMRERLGRSAMWSIVSEDLPDPANRVVLDPRRRDRAGTPGVRVEYRQDGNSKRLLAFHIERAAEALRAAGVRTVLADPLVRASGWHLMGTARMGEDPDTSVVDPWGRSHDVPNLHVFDSSAWPTSSGFNPAATQAAMALRSSAHFLAEESW
ncbi:GMC oxidoreductase [Brevibacterium album]|uniref:GMC oxidoreductase n=1 Tax=Brevibacterium album TaxID=417948 RepID=UPI00041183BC|nr:GMC family oxidoreductase [Brevibacterium album]